MDKIFKRHLNLRVFIYNLLKRTVGPDYIFGKESYEDQVELLFHLGKKDKKFQDEYMEVFILCWDLTKDLIPVEEKYNKLLSISKQFVSEYFENVQNILNEMNSMNFGYQDQGFIEKVILADYDEIEKLDQEKVNASYFFLEGKGN